MILAPRDFDTALNRLPIDSSPDSSGVSSIVPFWTLQCGDENYVLTASTYLIGRGGDASIRVDAASVSRRHAALQVSQEKIELRDLGSKNGTWVADEQVQCAAITDNVAIRIGTVWLFLRRPGGLD